MEEMIKRKKLGLNKSSLRELTAAEMTYVAGGGDDDDVPPEMPGDGGSGSGSGSGGSGGSGSGGSGIFESAVCTTSCNSCFGCGAPPPSYTCPPAPSNTCPNPASYTCPTTK